MLEKVTYAIAQSKVSPRQHANRIFQVDLQRLWCSYHTKFEKPLENSGEHRVKSTLLDVIKSSSYDIFFIKLSIFGSLGTPDGLREILGTIIYTGCHRLKICVVPQINI